MGGPRIASWGPWTGPARGPDLRPAPGADSEWRGGSRQLQSDGLDGQHLYWDVESSKQMLVPAEVRDA